MKATRPILGLCHAFFLALAPALPALEPPSCEWVFSGGGGAHDKTRAVATDRQGNMFLASESVGDGIFGDKRHQSAGGMDMCLVKLDAAGRVLWVSGLGGSKTDRAYGMVTDAAGNAYVTGHFESVDLVVHGETLPQAGSYDAFTAKFSPDGKVQWVRVQGGTGYDYGHGIAIDSKGHLIVVGAIGGRLFCTKYDAEGREIWHRTPSGTLSGSLHGVAVDGTDHIHLGGNATGAGAFGKAVIDSKTSSALVVKLTPDGEGLWASAIPATLGALYHEITCDSVGRVWGVGMFKGSINVAGKSFQTGGEKDNDGLIVQIDASGQVRWAHTLHGPGTDYCLGVATDDRGAAFVCGDFNQDSDLAGHALVTRGSGDIFLAGFDAEGGLVWVQQAGGKQNDSAYPIVYRDPGELVMAGAFAAPATFGSREVKESAPADLYAAKWRLAQRLGPDR